MEIPERNSWKIAESRTLNGVQVLHRAEGKIDRAANLTTLIDFETKIDISVLMARKLSIEKTSKISKFQRKSFATLKEAEAFQKQKRAELERHREGRFNLDDREMLSQARNLASRIR